MESRVIDEIRKEIGCGDTLSDHDIARAFSSTFTESRIALGLAVKDLKGSIRDALPAWLANRLMCYHNAITLTTEPTPWPE